MDSQFYFGGAVKMVSDNESEGYLVRFTNQNKRDLHRQWFSQRTEFMLDVNPIIGKMTLFNHGMHPNIGTIPTGKITHAELRDDGIFVKKSDEFRQQFQTYAKNRAGVQTLKPAKEFLDEFMDEIDQYEKMLADLRESGYFKFSSGALPQSVEWNHDTGEILKWQIIEGSETGTPAEPRMLTQIHTSKSFNLLDIPYLTPSPKGVYQGVQIPTSSNNVTISFPSTDTTSFTLTTTQDGLPKEAIAPKEDIKTAGKGVNQTSNQRQTEDTTMPDETNQTPEKQADTPPETKPDGMSEDTLRKLIQDELSKSASESEPDKTPAPDPTPTMEQVKSVVQDILTEMKKADKAEADKTAAAEKTIRDMVQAEIKSAQPNYARNQVGTRISDKTTKHISVAEPEMYRHLTSDEMALGVKLAYAKLEPFFRPQVSIGDIFSEGYCKSLAHKMQADVKALREIHHKDTIGQMDQADMKFAVKQFTKADELNASDITNQGGEFATVYYDTRLWDRVRENTQLFNMLQMKGMRTQDLPPGSESMDVYLVTSSGTVYTGRQANSTNSVGVPETVVDIEAFGTDKVNIPLAKHTLAYGITYELEERSIINVVQVANMDIAETLGESLEDALINGDNTMTASTNINLNDSTPATTTYGQTPLYIAFDGIRHAYLVDHTARKDDHSGAVLQMTDFEDTVQLFDNRFRTRRNQMLFILDTKTESALRKLPELLTRDTAGDQMSMFTGAIPKLFGVDPYTSGFMPRTGTAGTISSTGSGTSPNTLGGIACVYAPFWQYGRQRSITIETQRYAVAQTTVMVASVTHAFRRRGDNAAAGKYNMVVV